MGNQSIIKWLSGVNQPISYRQTCCVSRWRVDIDRAQRHVSSASSVFP